MKSFTATDILHIEVTHTVGDPSKPQSFKVSAIPTNPEAFLANFPKSSKVFLTTLSTQREGKSVSLPYLSGHGSFVSSGVNGGKNETGIKRLHSILKAAHRAGVEIEYTISFSNSYPTLAEALHALAES